MKKYSMLSLSAALSVTSLTMASNASAQSYRYDGPAVDINFQTQRPSELTYCRDRYRADGYKLDACTRGMSEASRMAERYAGGWGRTQGYLRGYAWGLHKTADIHANDAREQAAGAAGVNAIGGTMEAGLQAGRAEGARQGSARGSQDAIARFTSVVNTGRQPDPTVRIPTVSYAGETNAYEKYVGQPKTVQQIIQQDLRPGEMRVYDSWDAMYLGEKQPLTIWDIWFSDGVYKFEHGQFYRTDLAWNTWLQRRGVLDPNGLYDNLNASAPVDPATGQQTDLKPFFQEGFQKTYEYYVNYNYSSQFQQNLELGTQHGSEMGVQVGKRVAYQTGLIKAYNDTFQVSSQQTFQGSLSSSYTGSFNTTFADHRDNPKLSIEFKNIIGMDDDGIIQPGEAFKAVFTVMNIGGKPSPLTVSVSGNVVEAVQQSMQINALTSREYTSEVIGRIDPRTPPRSAARVNLHVNGLVDDLHQTVLRMTQIASTRALLDVNNGSGSVTVVATNTSTVQTPRAVSASLYLNGRSVNTAIAGQLVGGENRPIELSFSNVDPMDLISGRVKASVILSMGDSAADQAEVALSIPNVDAALASYFNVLANGRGFVPVGASTESQIDEVRQTIVGNNQAETKNLKKGPNVYKKTPDATIPGMLAKSFEATTQSPASRDAYDVLAKAMWPARKNLKNFLFFGGKKKSYDQLVQRMAKSKLQ